MATLIPSTQWIYPPRIYLSATYSVRNRTSTSVQIRPVISISAVYGQSYFGWNIQAKCRVGSVSKGFVYVKNNTPNRWTDPITYDFGWLTVSATATATSIPVYIDLQSNGGSAYSKTFTGTASFPVGNTAPYWPSNATFKLNFTEIFPENTSTIIATTSGAVDSQGDSIAYRYRWYVNNILYNTQESMNKFCSLDVSDVAEGKRIHCVVDCRDYLSSFGATKTSNSVTKNIFTPATLSSKSTILFDTDKITFNRTSGSNSNGNTSFSYLLLSDDLTLYNTSWPSNQSSLDVSIWREDTPKPSGAYVKFSEIQQFVQSSKYVKNISFKLQTTNTFHTTKYTYATISANLQQSPDIFTLNKAEGTFNIKGNEYYIINRKALTLSWSASKDPLGGTISYDVEYSLNNSSWISLDRNISELSTIFPITDITDKRTFKFRVTAKTSYGTSRTVAQEDSEAVLLHYFNVPTIEDFKLNRETLSFGISWSVKQYTSISNMLYENIFTLKNGEDILQTITINKEGVSQYSTQIYTLNVDSETTTFTLGISWEDEISKILGLKPKDTFYIIPRYSARFTLREKGVGINTVAGDGPDFISYGSVSFNASRIRDSSPFDGFSLGAPKEAFTLYESLYVDSQGVLRAQKELPFLSYVFKINFGNFLNPLTYSYGVVFEDTPANAPVEVSWIKTLPILTSYNFFNYVYPVDSVFVTVSDKNPSEIFNQGTWELISPTGGTFKMWKRTR